MNEINEVVEGTEGNEQKAAKEAKEGEGNEQEVTEETVGEGEEKREQKEAKKEVDGLEIGQAEAPAETQGEEGKTEERVRAEDGGGRVDIEGVLRAIEEALPEFLRQSRAKAARREHPAGEAFFRGEAEEMTDGEAEEVARKQLERSGLLRGQRVRVGD